MGVSVPLQYSPNRNKDHCWDSGFKTRSFCIFFSWTVNQMTQVSSAEWPPSLCVLALRVGYMYTWMGMGVEARGQPWVFLGCFLLCFSYFGDRRSRTPELAKSGRLACQYTSELCLPLPAQSWDYNKHTTIPDIVYLCSGKQTQVLVLANKAFYPLSHLRHLLTPSEPPCFIFICVITIFVFLTQRLAL